jgi:hypothetical protein
MIDLSKPESEEDPALEEVLRRLRITIEERLELDVRRLADETRLAIERCYWEQGAPRELHVLNATTRRCLCVVSDWSAARRLFKGRQYMGPRRFSREPQPCEIHVLEHRVRERIVPSPKARRRRRASGPPRPKGEIKSSGLTARNRAPGQKIARPKLEQAPHRDLMQGEGQIFAPEEPEQ